MSLEIEKENFENICSVFTDTLTEKMTITSTARSQNGGFCDDSCKTSTGGEKIPFRLKKTTRNVLCTQMASKLAQP